MKKPFWANLIVLLIGMNTIGTLIGNSGEENVIEKESGFSIMSYNVRLFNAYNWIKKEGVKEDLFEMFKKLNSGW